MQFWFCGQCKASNDPSASRCRNCRAPREQAIVGWGGVPAGSLQEGAWETAVAGRGLSAQAAKRVPAYRSAATWAYSPAVLIPIVALLSFARLVLFWNQPDALTIGSQVLAGELPPLLLVRIGEIATAAVATFLWALWLRRSVINVAALTGSRPNAGPWWAFFCNFIPLVQMVSPFRVVLDLHRRLTVQGDPRDLAAKLWWAAILAWWLAPTLLGVALALALPNVEEHLRASRYLTALEVGLIIAAALLAVSVVLDLQDRQRAYRDAQVALAGSL